MSRVTQISISFYAPAGAPPCCCGVVEDCPDGWYVFQPAWGDYGWWWYALPSTWACNCLTGEDVCAGHEPNVSADDFVSVYGWSHFVFVRCAPPYDIIAIDTPPACP